MIGDPEDRRLAPLARELLRALVEHLRGLEERTAELDRRLVAAARDGAACERLAAVPGIGSVIATALTAAIGDAEAFASGRSTLPATRSAEAGTIRLAWTGSASTRCSRARRSMASITAPASTYWSFPHVTPPMSRSGGCRARTAPATFATRCDRRSGPPLF